ILGICEWGSTLSLTTVCGPIGSGDGRLRPVRTGLVGNRLATPTPTSLAFRAGRAPNKQRASRPGFADGRTVRKAPTLLPAESAAEPTPPALGLPISLVGG